MNSRLLRALVCSSFALGLGACTTADPKLPATAFIPIPETSPRVASAEMPAADGKVKGKAPAKSNSKAEAAIGETTVADAAPVAPSGNTSLDGLISKYSVAYAVPESLVRRVVQRESRYNPAARNGPYWGLMQMLPATARGMGHQGSARDLLDAETNLKYGVKYLAGAYKVADYNPDQAVRLYSRGYYYQAKRKGLLEETGLKPSSTPVEAVQTATAVPTVQPEQASVQPTQLGYASETVALPSVVSVPMQRPDAVSPAPPVSTTNGNGVPGRVPAPL